MTVRPIVTKRVGQKAPRYMVTQHAPLHKTPTGKVTKNELRAAGKAVA